MDFLEEDYKRQSNQRVLPVSSVEREREREEEMNRNREERKR